MFIYYLIFFLIGLSVGSFLNVVTFRYEPRQSVFHSSHWSGRSRCPHCGKTLEWFELIPLFSFLIQGGKCRSCGGRLSLQYPLVELASGLVFVAVPFYFQRFYAVLEPFSFSSSLRSYYGFLALWILVFLTWLLITIIDTRHYIIPDGLNITLAVLGLVITFVKSLPSAWLLPFNRSFLRHYELIFSPSQTVWVSHLLGAIAALIFFGLLVVLSQGRAMGMGDVKLGAASGLVLGWPDMGLALMLAFILGGIWGGFLLITGRKTMRDKIPFAPIFILGMVLTIFLGFKIVQGYFSLFNI